MNISHSNSKIETKKSKMVIAPGIEQIEKYIPGRTIEEVTSEIEIKPIIKLASNENPFGMSPKAEYAIRNSLKKGNQYPPIINPVLQQKIAEINHIKPTCIVTGNGADSILYSACNAFLTINDEVLIPEVTFDIYKTASLIKGAKIIEIPMPDLFIEASEILKRVTSKTRMIFLCNPNNPTGSLMSLNDLKYLIENISENIILVHDEVYHEFADKNLFPDLVPYITSGHTNLILVRSMSKAYGLAGIRFGYGIMAEKTATILHKVRPPFDNSILAQEAAIAALSDIEFLKKTLVNNQKVKLKLYSAFQRLGFNPIKSHANFILVDLQQNADKITEKILQKGIIVRKPTHPRLSTYIRVSLGKENEIERFIDTIKEIFEK